jgi:hypothetical protein
MDLRVQLKVCEGCGCLWYRAQNHSGVYCLGCDAKLKQFPSAQSRRRRGPKKAEKLINIWAVAQPEANEGPFAGLPSYQHRMEDQFAGTPEYIAGGAN